MTPERWQQIEKLYHAALERDADERPEYLRQACAGDEALRQEVESLLAHDGAPGLLKSQSGERTLMGRQLGSYEILSLLGAGGMGEVYEAHDTKLGRNVAIKVLPSAFVHDPERLARFQREARMLAALNHPNIATIYGLEESDGMHYLVMEVVPGETLRERIARGAVPVEESLKIAVQIAEALEAAHEKGIIHRDLKPANVTITPEGKVKVLDFGLAKVFSENVAADSDPSQSPTLNAATKPGLILGTAAYMSPEQAKGKVVDRRADIWAFGCVLFEMLTGRQAFEGEDITEVLAAVMTKEPALDLLPAKTPTAIRNLLRRCLEKNLTRRLQHIGEARILLEDVLSGAVETEFMLAAPRRSHERILMTLAAVALLAAIALGGFSYFRPMREAPQEVQFFISPPEAWTLATALGSTGDVQLPLTVSPDGKRVAFVATGPDGKSLIWVRSLDGLTAESLAGTEDALRPFWSPDSRFLAFFADGKLKKIDLAGGPPTTLCAVPDERGGTWSRDGVIVFANSIGSGLMKVSSAGGEPSAATVLGKGETGHFQPYFLPDGRHFLYRAIGETQAGTGMAVLYLGSLDSTRRKLLLKADAGNVAYSQGHLLFLRETTLMAQPFDAQNLELAGEPFPIAEGIRTSVGAPPYAYFSASQNGVLVYQTGPGETTPSQLKWFDRAGRQIGVLGDVAVYGDLELSPDGKRAAVNVRDQTGKGRDIWLYDVVRGLRTRFTFDPADESSSAWSPDGSRLVFGSDRKGLQDLYEKASSGVGAEEVLYEDKVVNKWPQSWSADGRFILYFTGRNSGTRGDLFVLPLSGDHKPFPFAQTAFSEIRGRFSPDGRWIAYASDESGKLEVYVAPFPGPGGKRQISTGGGTLPRWRRDGNEIFYIAPDNEMMAASVSVKGESFEVGSVKPLFKARMGKPEYEYDVSADGQRFLIITPTEQAVSSLITVVVNWTAGLKK